MSAMRYLPEGLVEGVQADACYPKDQVMKYNDVKLPVDGSRPTPGRAVPALPPRLGSRASAGIGTRGGPRRRVDRVPSGAGPIRISAFGMAASLLYLFPTYRLSLSRQILKRGRACVRGQAR